MHPFLVCMEGPRCAGVAHPLLLLRGEDGRFATRPFHPSGEEERLPCHRYQGGLGRVKTINILSHDTHDYVMIKELLLTIITHIF